MEKTRIRWSAFVLIILIAGIAIVWSSYNYHDMKLTINSDSNTYNITKDLTTAMEKISEKQDYYYREYVKCAATLNVNNISTW